jgi:hypothetical protein
MVRSMYGVKKVLEQRSRWPSVLRLTLTDHKSKTRSHSVKMFSKIDFQLSRWLDSIPLPENKIALRYYLSTCWEFKVTDDGDIVILNEDTGPVVAATVNVKTGATNSSSFLLHEGIYHHVNHQ